MKYPVLAVIAVTIVFTAVGITHLDGLRWDYDEGVHAMEAALVLDGAPLYREVFSSDMPLFIGSLTHAFRLLGTSIQAARMVTLLYSAIGLLAVGLLTGSMGYPWAGPVAALMLAISPDFFLYSRVCMEDLPALALAALAILLAHAYSRSGRREWLPLAGLAYGLALLLKLVPVVLLPVLMLLIVRRHLRQNPPWGTMLVNVALFSVFAGLPLVLAFVLNDPGIMFEQVIGFPAQATAAYASTRCKNMLDILRYLVLSNIGMTMLAVFCLWASAMRRRVPAWPAVLWLFLMCLALLLHVPLWPHLLTGLLLPLAILGAIGLVEVIHILQDRSRPSLERRAASLALVVFVISSIWALVTDASALKAPSPSSATHAIGTLVTSTPADALILTDEALIAFAANRQVPAQLTDTSFKRIKSGLLTANQVIAVAEAEQPDAAFLWSDRRFAELPELVTWIEMHYRSEMTYADGSRLFLDPVWAERSVP